MSEVFFFSARATASEESKINKVSRLFDSAKFSDLFDEKELVAIKVHFGERGNDGFVPPMFIRKIIDKVKAKNAKPFVTDTNTLYKGGRMNAVDHLETAVLHGFTYATLNAPVIIADGLKSNSYQSVEVNLKHLKAIDVARDIFDANSMIVVSHFKGHVMCGFGGAIKHLAMGCATRVGKKRQHAAKAKSDNEKCIGCGKCADHCPSDAIIIQEKAMIDQERCIGCGECMVICPTGAMGLDWETEIGPFTERVVESAYGAIKNKKGKVGFINFVVNVTPDCDCLSFTDVPIVRDIGILASKDPVALDQACYDLVNAEQGFLNTKMEANHEPGMDKFKGIFKYTKGEIQLEYGEKIGLGSRKYKLIQLDAPQE